MCRVYNAKLIIARLERIARSVSMSRMRLFVGRMGRVAATVLGAQRHGSQNDRLDLLERALIRRLIWTPAHQLRSMAKSIAGDMVEPHLNDEFGSQRLPFPASFGAPAARTARGFSGEAGCLA